MKKVSIQEFTRPYLEDVIQTIADMPWSNPRVYGDFLAQTHYHICHTTRLLAAAGSLFDQSQNEFHIQCMKHAAEERSHEKLSVSDMKEIGFTIADFPELPATKALYRNAYYLIDRVDPITLFGYAYFLECIGAGVVETEKKMVEIYGAKAVKHVSLHAHEDPGHIAAYEGMLNQFEGNQRALLEEGTASTAYHYRRIYEEVRARSGQQRVLTLKRKAA